MSDSDETPPPSWRERHAATMMGGVLFGLLALIMMVQAC